MTIYYLYVKTHNITGLKYLGYTTRKNPYKYKGSGIYWADHIKKHGYDVTTEILKECSSHDELKECGIYYSTLWDIVNSRDSTGKKIWANMKLEDGIGGKMEVNSLKKSMEHPNKPYKIRIQCENCGKTIGKPNYLRSHGEKCGSLKGKQSVGKNNGRYNHTILHFYNVITDEHVHCTRYELYTTYNLNKGSIGALCSGKIIEHDGWILEENLEKFRNNPDNVRHKFLNINTDEEKEMTILELSRTYNLRYNLIKRMVNNRNHKMVKGWTVL